MVGKKEGTRIEKTEVRFDTYHTHFGMTLNFSYNVYACVVGNNWYNGRNKRRYQ
jgi:hypothetical protein